MNLLMHGHVRSRFSLQLTLTVTTVNSTLQAHIFCRPCAPSYWRTHYYQPSDLFVSRHHHQTWNPFLLVIIVSSRGNLNMMPMNTFTQSRSAMQVKPFIRSVTPETKSVSESNGFSTKLPSPKTNRSESAPIAFQKLKRTNSEIQLDAEEAMADHRDYAMFQRIVRGIQETQSQTRDCRWRHSNNMSLQRVYKTRHEEKCHSSSIDLLHCLEIPSKLQMVDPDSLKTPTVHQDEQAMPFAMEL
jgi:hypothetical protein